MISLTRGLRNAPGYKEEYELTSPPAVINGMIVTGSAVADNGRTNAASGEVRAFDARTGAQRWSWDPVPRDSTDAAWDSWRGIMAHTTGAANAWSVIAADSARDLVFVPTGSASPDYYGGERLGDNRYANSIVALRASTGKVVWSFQAVHHDLWDYDVASPPALVEIMHDGTQTRRRAADAEDGTAVRARSRHRRAGISGRGTPVPPSTIFGERTSPTQPFNTVIPSLSPQSFRSTACGDRRPRDREACLAQISAAAQRRDVHAAEHTRGRSQVPSNVGGAHWGGLTFDPSSKSRRDSGEPYSGVRAADSTREARHCRNVDRTRIGSVISTRACTVRRT